MSLGSFVQFESGIDVVGAKHITIGDKVKLGKDTWLNVVNHKTSHGKIFLDDGVDVGRYCVISSSKSIRIERNVLIAQNVMIVDHAHKFDNIKRPIMFQGIDKELKVSIGRGTWIGTNSVILPGAVIGKNCVIGCNSTVNSIIPDYTIAVGSPAKVIRKLK